MAERSERRVSSERAWHAPLLCRDVTWPDSATRLRAELAVRFGLAAGGVCVAYAAIYGLTFHYPVGAAVLLVGAACFLSVCPLLRKTRSPAAAAHLLALSVLAVTSFVGLVRPDFPVSALMFHALVPIVTLYLAGRRTALIWSLVALGVCAGFAIRSATGNAVALIAEPPAVAIVAADALGIVALVLLVLLLVERIVASQANVAREEKRLVEELAEARREESIGAVAAGVAHHVNNPLAAVVANLQELEEELSSSRPDGVRADCLRDAMDGATRVRDLVRELHNYAELSLGSTLPVHLPDVVEMAAAKIAPRLDDGLDISFELEQVPTVHGNADHLLRVVTELLNNAVEAVHASQRAGKKNRALPDAVMVRCWAESDEVCLEVRDRGCGFTPQVRTRMWEPFFTTKDSARSSGLGLAVCDAIIRAHGGHIDAMSEPGSGSRFIVRLPAALTTS